MDFKPRTNVLITTDDWFFSKTGREFKAVWGPATIHRAEDVLGFAPRQSTNWFVEVGTIDPLIIFGCGIHYVQLCEEKPTAGNILVME